MIKWLLLLLVLFLVFAQIGRSLAGVAKNNAPRKNPFRVSRKPKARNVMDFDRGEYIDFTEEKQNQP
jgi:hypothetical protein